jgi:hypothetical protein
MLPTLGYDGAYMSLIFKFGIPMRQLKYIKNIGIISLYILFGKQSKILYW